MPATDHSSATRFFTCAKIRPTRPEPTIRFYTIFANLNGSGRGFQIVHARRVASRKRIDGPDCLLEIEFELHNPTAEEVDADWRGAESASRWHAYPTPELARQHAFDFTDPKRY